MLDGGDHVAPPPAAPSVHDGSVARVIGVTRQVHYEDPHHGGASFLDKRLRPCRTTRLAVTEPAHVSLTLASTTTPNRHRPREQSEVASPAQQLEDATSSCPLDKYRSHISAPVARRGWLGLLVLAGWGR